MYIFEITSFPKDILKIRDKNYNIINLHIHLVGKIDCILYDFQNLFPNLTELNLDFQSSKEKHNFGIIEIKEKNIYIFLYKMHFLYLHNKGNDIYFKKKLIYKLYLKKVKLLIK